MLNEAPCPGCGQPLTPGDRLTAVVYNAAGARAHLGCLEAGLNALIPELRRDRDPGERAVYLLAARTASPAWLGPQAAFVQLVGEHVLVQVPLREADAQQASLRRRGAGGARAYYYWTDAEAAARGAAGDAGVLRLGDDAAPRGPTIG